MTKYNSFLFVFIVSLIALALFLVFFLQGIFSFAFSVGNNQDPSDYEVFQALFTPQILVSGIVLAITSLIYRVIGIVQVAKNKLVSDGEKVLWILGFIFMGFITAIIFLVLAKKKQFVE